jgi:microcystin-dependent protein
MGAVPRGAILMWSGNPAQLPKGWVLCDSQNGTPDLRSRFIVGYDPRHADNKTMGKTGGEDQHALTTAEMPSHNHGQSGNHTHSLWASGHGWAFRVVQTGDTRAKNDSHTVYTSSNGAHTHASEGGGAPHENRPPYYVLAYIMYTGK